MSRPLAVVVLAAGEGTRMRSRTPKVLHGFAGRSLLDHVLAAAQPLGAQHTVVVVGSGRDQVTATLPSDAVAVVQEHQLGTGHAAAVALEALPSDATGTIVVLPGDAPLLRPATLRALAEQAADVAVLTSELEDPTGYGRVLRDEDGSIRGIVEQKDADEDERRVREVGTSVYAFDAALLREAVRRLGTDNAQGEQYLTDVVGLAVGEGRRVTAVRAPAEETAGVNDRVQLAAAARIFNERLLQAHMRAGVTVLDPGTTWIDATVELEPDVTLLPGTELHGRTTVAAGAVVGPHTSLSDTSVGSGSRLERVVAVQARIGADVTVGPFAYLRPGTVLADGVHVGTYVELKNADVGAGTKIPHLSYVGDATIGEQTNIGAATVFVNYDGVAKHHTTIGSHARTGADNMFVAPVTVGDGAYTAAGAVITKDVPAGALARSSARQQNVPGWVAERRPGTAAATAAERAGAERQDEERPSP